MSQHYFTTSLACGLNVSIMAGWDPCLNRFFADVEKVPSADEQPVDPLDLMIYESYRDKGHAGQPSAEWTVLEHHLKGMGITVPVAMSAQIVRDKTSTVVNSIMYWDN